MKKLMAMLLALALTLALCACGNQGTPYVPPVNNSGNGATTAPTEEVTEPVEEEPEVSPIVGKWAAEIDITEFVELDADYFVEEGMDETLAELMVPDGVTIDIILEFTEDGDMIVTVDGERGMKDWMGQISEKMALYLKLTLEESGASEEDFEEEYGMSIEEFVEVALEESFAEQELELSEEYEFTYELEGDKLYLDGGSDYVTVDIDDDELTLDFDDEMEDVEYLEGLVFERQ